MLLLKNTLIDYLKTNFKTPFAQNQWQLIFDQWQTITDTWN